MSKIRLITLEDLLEMKENDIDFKLVEVLGKDQFKEDHIPGAINIPEENLEEEASKKLQKDDKIVVYCASYACHSSTESARKLNNMGYSNVVDFKAGKQGWRRAGLKFE